VSFVHSSVLPDLASTLQIQRIAQLGKSLLLGKERDPAKEIERGDIHEALHDTDPHIAVPDCGYYSPCCFSG
jgi:hypothetical protein